MAVPGINKLRVLNALDSSTPAASTIISFNFNILQTGKINRTMAFCRAGFCAGTSFTIFLLTGYKTNRTIRIIPGRNSWGEMESLGSRTAVLGQPLCKFLFADDSGISGNLRQWSVKRSVSAFLGTYGELQNVYHDDSA